MRVGSILFAAACLLSTASGQWLETTIDLPEDRLGPRSPNAVVTTADKVYVGGPDGTGMLVLDAATMSRTGVLPGLVGVRPLAWAPSANKVYAIRTDRPEVVVVDAATDSVTAVIPVGRRPLRLLHDPVRNVVYCLSYNPGELAVIDVGADSVVAVVPLPRNSFSLALDPGLRKLYCTSLSQLLVTVVDADADTVIAAVTTTATPLFAVSNPARRKVYVTAANAVDIIDATADTLLGSIPGIEWPFAVCYNPDDDKVYVAEEDSPCRIYVIDCGTDSIITSLPGGYEVWDAVYNPAANAVYVSYERSGRVVVISGADDRVVAQVELEEPVDLVVDQARNRVYCTEPWLSQVSVIDGASHRVVRELRTRTGPLALDYDPLANRLYCADGATEDLFVIDGADNLIAGSVPLGRPVLGMRANPGRGRLYCATDDGAVLVYDTGLDSVVTRLELGFAADLLEWNTAADKLYAAGRGGDRVAVINCATDRLETVITLGSQAEISGLQAVPQHNEVYVASGPTGLLTVIEGGWNRVTAYIAVEQRPAALAYAPRIDRVYCGHEAWQGNHYPLTVVDPGHRVVVDTAQVSVQPGLLAMDSTRNMLYVAAPWLRAVSIVDCTLNLAVGALSWSRAVRGMLVDTRLARLYVADPSLGLVGVFDLDARELLVDIPVGPGAQKMVWNPGFDRVYVACGLDRSIAVIRDSLVVGVAEQAPVGARPVMATVVRGRLVLPATADRGRSAVAVLLDPTGRRVMELQPGENDVRHLAPGVYFVRTEGSRGQGVEGPSAKVVIQR